jgi:hypothetical protein
VKAGGFDKPEVDMQGKEISEDGDRFAGDELELGFGLGDRLSGDY